MHDSQWLDHHGKRKNYLWLVILIAAVCIAAGIFIRNNSDMFGASHRQNKETAAVDPGSSPQPKAPQPAASIPSAAVSATAKKDEPVAAGVQSAPAKAIADTQQDNQARAAAKNDRPVKAASVTSLAVPGAQPEPLPAVNESVPLERISCRLMDKSQPSIRLSLVLSFPPNRALLQEILVKRDNLKVMVKKTLASKSMDDMVVDSLRKDLKNDLNSVLENGAITDIEFKEFRIEKVE